MDRENRSEAEVGEALTEALQSSLEDDMVYPFGQNEVKDIHPICQSGLLTDDKGFVLYLENGQRFQVSVKEF